MKKFKMKEYSFNDVKPISLDDLHIKDICIIFAL